MTSGLRRIGLTPSTRLERARKQERLRGGREQTGAGVTRPTLLPYGLGGRGVNGRITACADASLITLVTLCS